MLTTYLVVTIAMLPALQQGDHAGEAQPDLPAEWLRAAGPSLTPAQSLEAMVVEPGFRVELVASEPLIRAPIACCFAPDGALWVLEMPAFMSDVDGSRELEPSGRVVVLRDSDADGVMDRATTFLDHLVLPRGLALSHDGALVIEPPHLMYARDTDGDGRADETRIIATGFEGIHSPEHAGNAITYCHDGYFALAQHPFGFAFDGEDLRCIPTPARGQWGMAVDAFGRLYTSTNSDPLLFDPFPFAYAARNPVQRQFFGLPTRVIEDFRVYPATRTPGVNRGYQGGFLRDGKLVNFTAACGPAIYDDDILGAEIRGDAFICEPAANLVQRYHLRERLDDAGGALSAELATPGRAFLASTDERFRPVSAYPAPDGALYICDFARGILQHKLFVTSFLRKQIIARGLALPTDLGRIWRAVPENGALRSVPDPTEAPDSDLAGMLAHDSGTIRNTAMRLLAERDTHGDGLASEALDIIASLVKSPDPALRHHALKCMGILAQHKPCDSSRLLREPRDPSRVSRLAAMLAKLADDLDSRVRCDVCDLAVGAGVPGLLEQMSRDSSAGVRLRAILAAGDLTDADSVDRLLRFAAPALADRTVRDAVVAGLANRERAALDLIAGGALDVRSEHTAQLVQALGTGVSSAKDLRAQQGGRIGRSADESGAPSSNDRGYSLYFAKCAQCHHADGMGMPPVYPPLRGSEFVSGDPVRLINIVMHGISGPLKIDGVIYRGEMPPASFDSDEDAALLLTWMRANMAGASPVTADQIKAVRESPQPISLAP